jgi:hypothetical protein
MKPFRFGVGLRQARSRAEVAEKARRVEALGYDLLGVADHLTDGLGTVRFRHRQAQYEVGRLRRAPLPKLA